MRIAPPSSDDPSSPSTAPVRALLDGLMFASVLAAAVAAALARAVGLALTASSGASPRWVVPALAFAGTLVVYNVDRLRDLERDRIRAPERSVFIARHRGAITLLTVGSAIASGALALLLDARVWGLCGVGLAVGLLHRRLKGVRALKVVYVTAVWVLVVVGLPVLALGSEARWSTIAWITLSLGSAITANLVATNLRRVGEDDPDRSEVVEANRPGLRLALLLSVAGVVLGTLAPEGVRALALVPLAEAIALVLHRPTERYALAVVDSALLVGAVAAIALLGFGRA